MAKDDTKLEAKSKFAKCVFPLKREIPPWFPVEMGGRGALCVPGFPRTQSVSARRGISGGMVCILFDQHPLLRRVD